MEVTAARRPRSKEPTRTSKMTDLTSLMRAIEVKMSQMRRERRLRYQVEATSQTVKIVKLEF